tara:strand:+ start:1255 stop:1989 length:735 start_codon:yes stop_codon:yes gene_type:complete
MLSKFKIKIVKSLKYKKNRINSKLFLVEGIKGIREVLNSDYNTLFTILSQNAYDDLDKKFINDNVFVYPEKDIKNFSSLKNNYSGIAVVEVKKNNIDNLNLNDLTIALDHISDPGNLGTIIRIADWYNIKNIICSKNSVDFYNPKVIQASMGSFTRVNTYYTDLDNILKSNRAKVFGTSVEGKNINKFSDAKNGIIVFGNESNGIRTKLKKNIDNWLSIKKYGDADSLNVSVSVGIILNEIRSN